MKLLRSIAVIGAMMTATVAALAQEPALPDFAPVSAEVKSRAWPIDPAKGYVVRELKPTIYMVTDGRYQSLFVVTNRGVVLFDAPPSLLRNIEPAVAEVTKQSIVSLVYSHGHIDHIGGAGVILKRHPNLEIIAEEGVAHFLKEQKDPSRPVPNKTFKEATTLDLAPTTVQLKIGHWHSAAGDLLAYFPAEKILMAIDTISPAQTMFMGFNLTQNTEEYIKVFSQLLSFDFETLVTGHRSNPATREDVVQMQQFVNDVYETAKRVSAADTKTVIGRAVAKYKDNGYAVARAVTDSQVAQCEKEINSRWLEKISNMDVYAASQCMAALVYFQFDVGPRSGD